ncbi:MAG TPA: ATPase domain-containing protein [Granulicella sp.]|nr:ATPase domain-containing protein [Granulicella sp.]
MPSAANLRTQIEAALAHRVPAALTPAPRSIRPVVPTGIAAIDTMLEGGLPLGGITEVVGQESSGRTALALSFVATMTAAGKVCAWIDVSNALDPESAAAVGVDLERLLWVRCGVPAAEDAAPAQQDFRLPERYLVPPPVTKGLHGGGFGPHPRGEVKGMSEALGGLLERQALAPRCAEPQRRIVPEKDTIPAAPIWPQRNGRRPAVAAKPWARIEQALRVADLLLQAGGFGSIVLDMADLAPEYALRVPLTTWFRYRAAAERTQASVLLLTQQACAKSSAALVLRLAAGNPLRQEQTVFAGMEHRVEVVRQRFPQTPSNVVAMRRPAQKEAGARWRSGTPWVGPRAERSGGRSASRVGLRQAVRR